MARIFVVVSFGLLTALHCVIRNASSSSCNCTMDPHGLTVDCRHKHLTTIPDDIPSDVTTLLLAHNNINRLSSTLSGLLKVRHLDLSYNKLSHLESNVFANLRFLSHLNLDSNYLPLNKSGYPDGVFHGLHHLRSLRLNNNMRLHSTIGMDYPSHQLAELPALEELFIDGLANGRFGQDLSSLSKLTSLTISGRIGSCDITNITADYFTFLHNLQLLNMTKCSLCYIDEKSFAKLPGIRNVDISGNPHLGISNVLNMIHGLQNSTIEVLHINNFVDRSETCVRIPKACGQYLSHTPLKEIYIDNNYVVAVETGTIKLLPQTLEVLSVRNSRLEFGFYFFELIFMLNVRRIDLSGLNVGNVIPDFLEGAKSTQNEWIFPLPPSHEEFYSEDGTFRVAFDNVSFSPNRLRKISYRKNVITEWKGSVYGLDHLEEIDLSENFCGHITRGCLSGFYNLSKLRANNNYLGPFLKKDTKGEVFGYSKKLTFLDLSLNRIDVLPINILRSQINLEILNLSKNSISNINFKVSHMTRLTYLNLMSNQITSLSRMFTSQLDIVRNVSDLKVDLSDNPLLCSCTTLWFIRWMVEKKDMFQNHDFTHSQHLYTCSSESDLMSGRNVFDILVDLEAHCTSRLGLAMGLLAAVTCVVCLMVAGVGFRYRWKLRYLYYVARGRYRGHSVIHNGEEKEYDYHAFVSYADEDRDFALHTFIVKLENETNIRLCLHHRDFLPGESIAANILSAIQRSKRVVVVLSPYFLDSYWCRWEFEMARMESLYTERNMVVLVKYQEVVPRLVPRDMMYMMHTQTYVEFPQDPNNQDTFWTTLRHTLTEP